MIRATTDPTKRTGWAIEPARVFRKKGWPMAVIVTDADGIRSVFVCVGTRNSLNEARNLAHAEAMVRAARKEPSA